MDFLHKPAPILFRVSTGRNCRWISEFNSQSSLLRCRDAMRLKWCDWTRQKLKRAVWTCVHIEITVANYMSDMQNESWTKAIKGIQRVVYGPMLSRLRCTCTDLATGNGQSHSARQGRCEARMILLGIIFCVHCIFSFLWYHWQEATTFWFFLSGWSPGV